MFTAATQTDNAYTKTRNPSLESDLFRSQPDVLLLDISPRTVPQNSGLLQDTTSQCSEVNVAVYLARLGLRTQYSCAFEKERLDDTLDQFLIDEGVDTGSLPQSGDVQAYPKWFYLSASTLLRCDEAKRNEIYNYAQQIRWAGGCIVFDPTLHEASDTDEVKAKSLIAKFASVATIALPTLIGEDQLWGRNLAHRGTRATRAHAERWFASGVDLVVLKCGDKGAEIHERDIPVRRIFPTHPISPIDCTGAGDAFNAALIAGIAHRKTLDFSVRLANRLAGVVITNRGAIVPRQKTEKRLFFGH